MNAVTTMPSDEGCLPDAYASPAALGSYDAVAEHILSMVFRRRRSAAPGESCATNPCAECFAPHLSKVVRYIESNHPVHFVIPAFPAKSRNRRKVLGRLPDMAEVLAIESLQSFCDQVSAVYAPGAVITICSDGHVFSDSLHIPDEHVDEYGAQLQRIIRSTGGGSIGLYALRDAMPDLTWDERRRLLLEEYSEGIDSIREAVRTCESMRRMFNGIHRFMVEDNAALMPELSANQRRLRSKQTAYEVVQRSQAWSGLVAGVFPDAIRLSIHPQTHHGEKIGVHLLRTQDSWLTPWHGVVLDDGVGFTLVKRAYAESLGARLVWRHSRPSHFVVHNPDIVTGELTVEATPTDGES
ncbi:2-isocyano-3-(4-hydroxyphenyl)propanoate synthase [Nocardia amikacinitolerans]|uniref:L-tyrosine/L-tryptophan isonitrile synthase family protein n=1 Tax=Nocardia amikacinitolerans TaxID=756689 RepID=UPI000AE38133|nr:isocyanide synthase family protein [Nocardia amikacinitolerans]MCP2314743.1 2-isocyano-3-(4-hydroxyphenyl)propanoate synthase [Nocardia amikacinitolerans]